LKAEFLVHQDKVRTDRAQDLALFWGVARDEPGNGSVAKRNERLGWFEPLVAFSRQAQAFPQAGLLEFERVTLPGEFSIVNRVTDAELD